MAYKLRFVQKFQESHRKEFLELEAQFLALEKRYPEFPKGKRYLPYATRESNNTFIWESEFPTLQKAQDVLSFLKTDPRHDELFTIQSKYFLDSYTEIYETLFE